MANRAVLQLVLAPCVLLAHGLVETGSADLGADQPWLMLGKFGYGLGDGTYELRIRGRQPGRRVSATLEIFLDEDWGRVGDLEPCERAVLGPARKRYPMKASDEWGAWKRGTMTQVVRPHIWYFALSGCDLDTNSTKLIDFEFRARQEDGSELGVEFRYMPAAVLIALVCLTGAAVRFGVLWRQFQQRMGAVHPVVHALACAIALQWVAQFLRLFALRWHVLDGQGKPLVEAGADLLCVSSQVISSGLLVAISQGYTLPGSKGNELGSVKFLLAAAAFLHLTVVGHNKLGSRRAEKHHEHEGAVGWSIVTLRLALYAWFLVRIRLLQLRGSLKLQRFLQSFRAAGSLYLLSYPVLFMVVGLCAPYLRHPVMETGLVVMQLASAFWLSDLFLSKGIYYEISTLSSSPLPTTSFASFKMD